MFTKVIGSCSSCGYPLSASYNGEEVRCPMCGTSNIAQGVTMPTWLVAGGIGLALGVLLGPAIIASTESGSQWLARQARR